MNRRNLMKTLGLAGMTLSSHKMFAHPSPSPTQTVLEGNNREPVQVRKDRIPLWQSITSQTMTTLVAVGPVDDNLHFSCTELGSNKKMDLRLEVFQPFPDQEQIYHVHVDGMNPNCMYKITVITDSKKLSTERIFRTLHPTANRFATMSCSNFLLTSQKIWQQLDSQTPDFILYMGDSVYADTATGALFKTPSKPALAFDRYISTVMTIPLYHRGLLTPIYNIWDDHDFGWNNGDARHPHRDFMLKLFRMFFPLNKGFQLDKGPGVSFAETIAGVRFVFTDDRSFRSYDEATNQMFGQEQRLWIQKQLQNTQGPVAMICGSQFFGFHRSSDSLSGGHAQDFQWLMQELKAFQFPVFFMDGDVHYSRLELIPSTYLGYPTYQITSSAIHSVSAGDTKKRNVPTELGYFGFANFQFIHLTEVDPAHVHFSVQCFSKEGIEYQYQLQIQK